MLDSLIPSIPISHSFWQVLQMASSSCFVGCCFQDLFKVAYHKKVMNKHTNWDLYEHSKCPSFIYFSFNLSLYFLFFNIYNRLQFWDVSSSFLDFFLIVISKSEQSNQRSIFGYENQIKISATLLISFVTFDHIKQCQIFSTSQGTGTAEKNSRG